MVDAQRRAALIEYLASLGFTAEEMADAERRGRLFGLAGDALLRSGPPTVTARQAADRLGMSLDEFVHIWQALGLTVADPELPTLSDADLDALRSWQAISALAGADAALNFLRIVGATMSRLAEASSTMTRIAEPDVLMTHTNDELATAKAYRAIAELVPGLAALMDAVWRHHITSARVYFEEVIHDTSASVTCGVGFADLSGFTAMTQRLSPTELSDLLTRFGGEVSDVVHSRGGRVVKFIGDEVMWVTASPKQLVQIAVALVGYARARDAGLRVRAGLGYGSVLAIGGDYFGTPVNLAARLVSAAEPGQILAGADVRDALPDRPAVELVPLTLKGFETPVPAYDLSVDD
ncbi:adenylate/guanylate cyclase domain-containing protein [Mycolicibacterium flavescens]|uniref:Guanylate cyclase domain-containing protein n=1 Tax=Mycolicibacterium flavescens TaxID=1776 RepID=A0A1E3RMB2_MYCFV|nr:adenylate/guanylate cyclase domain-containing protein [Mycolicibacterium flavescens]ODQ91035.1 hypothetical protein BHQ18_06415 [Mycolicibacterium flavescens]